MSNPGRRSLSKRIRFEVFKRDSFRCKYCGGAAPEIVLHVDHVIPIAEGGTDDLLNLVTSCVACNLGKGARRLDDRSAVDVQRGQLEELQERREQLDMMLDWQRGLRNLSSDTVDELLAFWHERIVGWTMHDTVKPKIKKLVSKYGVGTVMAAMETAADEYLEFDRDGRATQASVDLAFRRVSGICFVERESGGNPDIKELFMLRGRARNRLGYFNDHKAIAMLREAYDAGVPIHTIRAVVAAASSWTRLVEGLANATYGGGDAPRG